MILVCWRKGVYLQQKVYMSSVGLSLKQNSVVEVHAHHRPKKNSTKRHLGAGVALRFSPAFLRVWIGTSSLFSRERGLRFSFQYCDSLTK
jgi:hypothetical protein